jgi:hypothetical protein
VFEGNDPTSAAVCLRALPVGNAGPMHPGDGCYLVGSAEAVDDRACRFHVAICSEFGDVMQHKSVAILETDEFATFRYTWSMEKEWVQRALDHSGLSQAALAREMHKRFKTPDDRSIINKILKSDRKVQAIEMLRIAKITGYPLPENFSLHAARHDSGDASGPLDRDNDEVRELDSRAGAGGGGTFDLINVSDEHENQISAEVVKDHWRIPTSFLRGELRLEASKAVMIEVTGDSGYDPNNPHAPGSVFPGDRVIVNAKDTRPTPPGPFLVYDGTGFVIKLCEHVHGSEPPSIRLASRNPTYVPYTITLDEGHIIVGRVVGRFTRM